MFTAEAAEDAERESETKNLCVLRDSAVNPAFFEFL
jgi:hypothetical protein